MTDANNAKSTIADKVHAAITSLLDTEMRLNDELNDARKLIRSLEDEKAHLRQQLDAENEVRRHLESMVSKIADIVRPR